MFREKKRISIDKDKRKEVEIQKTTRVFVYVGARMGPKGTVDKDWAFPLVLDSERTYDAEKLVPEAVSGGWGRMRALEALFEEHRNKDASDDDMVVLATGGLEKADEMDHSRSQKAKELMVKKYHIPQESIVSIGTAQRGSTKGNAADTFDYIKAHAEKLGRVSEVTLVTHDYHALRAWLIFQMERYRRHYNGAVLRVPKEEIAQIREILNASLGDVNAERGRQQIVEILGKYFNFQNADFPSVKVFTVEEGLALRDDLDMKVRGAGSRYAERIQKNPIIKRMRELENKGVIDLMQDGFIP